MFCYALYFSLYLFIIINIYINFTLKEIYELMLHFMNLFQKNGDSVGFKLACLELDNA